MPTVLCTADGSSQPAPGRYFRLLLVGYFEGIDSERGIAWRAADSFGIRGFLGLGLEQRGPDHSTISRTRRLIDVETHQQVFSWVLAQVAEAGLLKGKTVAVDATTLEANAAMRSIVRRDTGETYEEFLKQLAKSSGIKTPTREALARLDRRRKRKGSNEDWVSPADPDARITKMKDGRTHLAHKAEHAVDLDTGAITAITIQPANAGDTTTIRETLQQAMSQIVTTQRSTKATQLHADGLCEVVADKGYHSDATLAALGDLGLRPYISEPDRGRRKWTGDRARQERCYANRRRIRGERGRRLHRQRAERAERSFAHMYETGRMRRTYLRGHENILKRLLIHAGGFNLGLVMRQIGGAGTPRALRAVLRLLLNLIHALAKVLSAAHGDPFAAERPHLPHAAPIVVQHGHTVSATSATGC